MRNFIPNDSPTIKFVPTKNWAEANRVVGSLGKQIKAASIEAQKKLCKEILNRVIGHLIKQDLGWRKLTPKYKSRKSMKGWDTRILLASHAYFSNIEMWHRKNGWNVYVGVKPGIYGKTLEGKKSKLDIATIATIHEFSTNRKRRRPLWNPTIREMGSSRGFKQKYIKYLHTELRKSGLGRYIVNLRKF